MWGPLCKNSKFWSLLSNITVFRVKLSSGRTPVGSSVYGHWVSSLLSKSNVENPSNKFMSVYLNDLI